MVWLSRKAEAVLRMGTAVPVLRVAVGEENLCVLRGSLQLSGGLVFPNDTGISNSQPVSALEVWPLRGVILLDE